MKPLAITCLLAVLLRANPVAAQCTVSAQPVAFGNYLPFSGVPTDSTGSVRVNCGASATYTIQLGAGGSGIASLRRMSNGGSNLAYQLYTDATRTVVWGDGNGGTGQVAGACPPDCSTPRAIYGRIPIGQLPPSGAYTDTIIVLVIY